MGLLGPVAIRQRAAELGVTPTKKLGQNFVHDAGTVRKIVRESGVRPGETVLEIGPGLGSLTLGLLEAGAQVVAVEIDPVLAQALPDTVSQYQPQGTFHVHCADALAIASWEEISGGFPPPSRLIANLPYNVAVPILLHALQLFPSLTSALVMVQAEVADRLAAQPGSRTYGIPSVKVAWYGAARRTSSIGRNVFWPAPNVDSALVSITTEPPMGDEALRQQTFAVIDQAFSSRRKMLRGVMKPLLGEATASVLQAAGVDGAARAEDLALRDFVAIAAVAGHD